MKRIFVVIPTTSYRAHDFIKAANQLDVELVIGSERRQALSKLLPDTSLALNLQSLKSSIEKIKKFSQKKPLDAIIGVDEETVILAAMASEELGLLYNSVSSVKATRDKHLMRQKFTRAGLLNPNFQVCSIGANPKIIAGEVRYSCVLKPTFLSASQGVIRTNSSEEFIEAFNQIKKIITDPSNKRKSLEKKNQILMEDYIPGFEVAVEGILINGEFKLLTIFDKPDPLEGPYFIETIYITPSRYPQKVQSEIVKTSTEAIKAVGLTNGPVHAEMRINEKGIWILEIAARSIGGLCSRALKFEGGISLEELILRHAVGDDIYQISREEKAAGVMMMPVQRIGILKEVKNIEFAKQIPGIENIVITIAPEQKLEPLPFGSKYLGFIFARGDTPESVEKSIRKAYSRLEIIVDS
jgi:carbamoylphosphate synthase large subunit